MRQSPKPPLFLIAGLVYVVAAVLVTPWILEHLRARFSLTSEAAFLIVGIPLVIIPVCALVAYTAILHRRGDL